MLYRHCNTVLKPVSGEGVEWVRYTAVFHEASSAKCKCSGLGLPHRLRMCVGSTCGAALSDGCRTYNNIIVDSRGHPLYCTTKRYVPYLY